MNMLNINCLKLGLIFLNVSTLTVDGMGRKNNMGKSHAFCYLETGDYWNCKRLFELGRNFGNICNATPGACDIYNLWSTLAYWDVNF